MLATGTLPGRARPQALLANLFDDGEISAAEAVTVRQYSERGCD
jgi:hypothetical protein